MSSVAMTHNTVFPTLLALRVLLHFIMLSILRAVGRRGSLLLLLFPEFAGSVGLILLHIGGCECDGGGGAAEHLGVVSQRVAVIRCGRPVENRPLMMVVVLRWRYIGFGRARVVY
jgi:hypothetical protein